MTRGRFAHGATLLRIRTLVGLLLLAAAACVGEPTAQPAGETFQLKADRALLWEVSSPGATDTSLYLLGSVHVMDMPLTLGPELEQALDRSDILVLEVDTDELTEDSAIDMMLRYGTLEWGEQQSDFLSPETIEALEVYLVTEGYSQQQVDGVRRTLPWVTAQVLLSAQFEAAGLRAEYGVDRYFAERVGSSKPIVGLETVDEQMYAMSSHSAEVQEDLLRQALTQTGEADTTPLLASWKTGDVKALEKLVFSHERGDGPAEYDEFLETIYFARNARMAEGLIELLEESDDVIFAVVGAAHLVGEESVQDMLRDAGFTAQRVGDRTR